MVSFAFWALAATLGTWLVTALGAATVLFFSSPKPKTTNLMLGFAAGVMVAASVWSLLIPAMDMSESMGKANAHYSIVSYMYTTHLDSCQGVFEKILKLFFTCSP